LRLEAWSKAAASLGHAARLRPDHAPSHGYEATAHARLGRLGLAEAAARRAIEAAPERAAGHADLARILLAGGGAEAALAAADRALELDATLAAAQAGAGRALTALDRPAEAVEALLRALQAAPATGTSAAEGDLGPSALRAALADAHGRLCPAEEPPPLTAESAADPPTVLLLAGLQAWKRGHWEEAEARLAAGGSRAPEDPSFDFLRVEPLLRLGRTEEAADSARRVAARGGTLPLLPGAPAHARLETRRTGSWRAADFGPRAEHYARAVTALLPARPRAGAPPPDLLFVLDEDYGELTTVMLLLLGQDLAGRAVLAMPARLAARNRAALGGRVREYDDLGELRGLIDEIEPTLVLLCSAYLLGVHGLCDNAGLEQLVGDLERRGSSWGTTDPFLGLLGEGKPTDLLSIDLPEGSPAELLQRRRADEALLGRHFTHSAHLCRGAPHVYPAPDPEDRNPLDRAPSGAATGAAASAPRLSFSNPALQFEAPGDGSGRPFWLFILSRTDLDTQLLHEGEGFTDLVTNRMLDAVAAGRRALLLGPEELLQAAATRSPAREDFEFLPFCSFGDLAALVLAAECAFYWNAVSHSILLRLWNGLPVVLFDRGHLLRNLPALSARITRRTYQGVEPPYADHRAPLHLEAVTEWAAAARADASRRVPKLRAAPTPQAMIERLLGSP
jgi:hypothetical protein